MKLHIHLLHNIHNKLKQPHNDLNLELSYSLNHKENYYIDSYLKYYLTKINKYKINGNIIFNYSEVRIMKYLIRRGFNIYYQDNLPLKVVKLLLQQNANVYYYYDYALRFASENGHLEVVKLLLQNGANIDDYALIYASVGGHLEVVKLLLQHRADIHVQDDYALRWAYNGHYKLVKLLKSYM